MLIEWVWLQYLVTLQEIECHIQALITMCSCIAIAGEADEAQGCADQEDERGAEWHQSDQAVRMGESLH